MKNQARISSALFAVLCTSAATSHAAGFALIEQSASGMGNAFAGAAASAEDASTIFFNPAGMTYLPDNQLVVAAHAIRPSADFTNNGSHRSALTGGLATPGGNGGDAGDWALVPNLYFAKSINDSFKVGIGVSAPFGLKTDYEAGWVGRYQALKSELKTININPSIAFKANDQFSLGFGVSAMRAEATLVNAIDFGTICTALSLGCGAPQAADGNVRVHGDNWSWGWNAGVIFQPRTDTRIGLSYRSQVHHELEGDASFSGVLANSPIPSPALAVFKNGPITAKLTTPDSFSASVFHQINDQWDVMADATWTGWSNFENLTVVRSTGTQLGKTPENWENTMRYSVGASYRYNDSLKARIGVAYDESPVPDAYRTPRIPDNDRTWLSLGANYKFSPASSLDVGYSHIFVKDASINKVTDASSALLKDTLTGDYNSDVNILSVQFTHTF